MSIRPTREDKARAAGFEEASKIFRRKSMLEKVREFHTTFGVPELPSPGFPSQDRIDLRIALIQEEFKELMLALGIEIKDFVVSLPAPGMNLVEVADAICDLHYVLSGTSLEFGLPEDVLFEEVHRSNMSKADEDGTVHKREDGKILKSSRWSPPDISEILSKGKL